MPPRPDVVGRRWERAQHENSKEKRCERGNENEQRRRHLRVDTTLHFLSVWFLWMRRVTTPAGRLRLRQRQEPQPKSQTRLDACARLRARAAQRGGAQSSTRALRWAEGRRGRVCPAWKASECAGEVPSLTTPPGTKVGYKLILVSGGVGVRFRWRGGKSRAAGGGRRHGYAKTTSQLSKTPELQEDSPLGDRRAFCLSMKKARILARSGVNGANYGGRWAREGGRRVDTAL